MANRRLLCAGTLATALTLRYLWPHSTADAGLIAKIEPRRDPTVLREVLREVRHVPVPDEDEGDLDVAPPPEEADEPEQPEPGLDADGLTEDQRFESDAVVIEDRMSHTRGALMGIAKDAATGERLAGVTVIATSPALEGAQAAITDENGKYLITELPPGDYLVTFYYLDSTIERSGLAVAGGKITPAFQTIQQSPRNDIIVIADQPPVIDPTSTSTGITIDKNYIKNIPVPGRIFEDALGAAADSQGDSSGEDLGYTIEDDYIENIPVTRTFGTALGVAEGSTDDNIGVSFSGGTSLENTYYVDGEDIEILE